MDIYPDDIKVTIKQQRRDGKVGTSLTEMYIRSICGSWFVGEITCEDVK